MTVMFNRVFLSTNVIYKIFFICISLVTCKIDVYPMML